MSRKPRKTEDPIRDEMIRMINLLNGVEVWKVTTARGQLLNGGYVR